MAGTTRRAMTWWIRPRPSSWRRTTAAVTGAATTRTTSSTTRRSPTTSTRMASGLSTCRCSGSSTTRRPIAAMNGEQRINRSILNTCLNNWWRKILTVTCSSGPIFLVWFYACLIHVSKCITKFTYILIIRCNN